MNAALGAGAVIAGLAAVGFVGYAFERPPMVDVQRGYRGTGMLEIYNPRTLAALAAANAVPEAIPSLGDEGPKASEGEANEVFGEWCRCVLGLHTQIGGLFRRSLEGAGSS